MTVLTGLGALGLVIWLYLLFGRSGFWRADQRLEIPPHPGPLPTGERESVGRCPAVVAIVPARNEALTVARCMESLAAQDYGGALSILLVDDASTDATAARAQEALTHAAAERPWRIIAAPPLAKGWTGKLSALNAGLEEAKRLAPDAAFVWFTDADIVHGPRTLSALVAKAGEGRDLVSLMVRLHCRELWERLLIPAFVFFFQMLYPFPAVNARPSRIGGAAGGCMLIRRAALQTIGGLTAVKSALIDDCALAEALRRGGFQLWLGLAEESHSLRAYRGLSELWQMVARTAYTQLRHSPLLLLCTLAGLAAAFLLPPLLFLALPFHGEELAAVLGGAAWLLMALAYGPTWQLYGGGLPGSVSLPLAASFYAAMTADSARRHWRGAGGQWKERAYDFG
jgi:hopene-associated glycosyltransferase HpnB